MDFTFDLTSVFPPELRPGSPDLVARLGEDLLPAATGPLWTHRSQAATAMQRAAEVVDRMGEASAAAQGLRAPITTAARVRCHPEHAVYLMVDRESNGGLGSVVGLLKVGRKNLFLLDRRGEQNETYAQCILDFYVHERRQRSGCGRKLFEHMLKDQGGLHPRYMAIDRPSPKLLAFLRKYYGLDSVIPQVNNYVIYDGFFSSGSGGGNNNGGQGDAADSKGGGGGPPGVRRARIYMGKLQYI